MPADGHGEIADFLIGRIEILIDVKKIGVDLIDLRGHILHLIHQDVDDPDAARRGEHETDGTDKNKSIHYLFSSSSC